MKTERVTLVVYGLGCGGGGALTVERAMGRLKGMVNAYVNPATEIAYLEYDPSVLRGLDLVNAVEAVGFKAGELTRR